MFLGIDYGKKRIGLAIGAIFPKGMGFIKNDGDFDSIALKIKEICLQNDVEKIVVGAPTRANNPEQNDPSSILPEIEKFTEKIKEKTQLPIIFESEQFTSTEAERLLKEKGEKYSRKSGRVDEIAAILILEQYINSIKRK